MLGIMKAGGAFVAMDALQPVSRVEFIIKEVGMDITLCSQQQLSRCPGLAEKVVAVRHLKVM